MESLTKQNKFGIMLRTMYYGTTKPPYYVLGYHVRAVQIRKLETKSRGRMYNSRNWIFVGTDHKGHILFLRVLKAGIV